MPLPRTLPELRQFATRVNATKYAHIPAAAIPKPTFNDTTANGLTNAIIYDLVHVWGGAAYRINNGATYDGKKGVYRAGVTRRGIPDIIGVVGGRFIGIEVKIGTDRQSAHQREVENEITQAGGFYFIAKTYTDYAGKIAAALG